MHLDSQPALSLEPGDRFWKVLISDPVPLAEGASAVLCFFVLLRSGGVLDIIALHKTFGANGQAIGRTVLEKKGLTKERVDAELEQIKTGFTSAIGALTSLTIVWNLLDLSEVRDTKRQMCMIREFGTLGTLEHR